MSIDIISGSKSTHLDSLDSLLTQSRRLRFDDPALEARYHAERLEAAPRRIRLLTGLGIAVLAILGIFEFQIPSPEREFILGVRYGFMLPVWLALFLATWWRDFPRRAEPWIAFGIIAPVLVYMVGQTLTFVLPFPNAKVHAFVIIKLVVFVFVLVLAMPLRFRRAVIVTLACWGGTMGLMLAMLAPNYRDLVAAATNSGLFLVGMLGIAWAREADDRRLFAQREHVHRLHAELEIANRQKDRLFAVIGHDIRGPLSAIALNSAVAFRGGELPALREIAGDIHTSARQLLGLLDNLLDWARLQSGGTAIHAEDIALHELAAEVVKLYEPVARHAGVTLTTDIPPDLRVRTARPMLATIVRNLAGNALKATPAGGSVRIAAAPEEKSVNGERILISVTDTGSGLKPEKVAALGLARGQSLPADAAPRGLGLVVCREFAQKLGGELWAESAPGRGTTVCLALSPDDRESL